MAWEVPDNACITVSPPPLADIYFPDNVEGRIEARRLLATSPDSLGIAFCSSYRRDRYEPRVCAERDLRYFGGTNKCRRCPAGFMFEASRGEIPADEISDAAKEYEANLKAQAREFDEAMGLA